MSEKDPSAALEAARELAIKEILEKIEAARKNKLIDNEAANLATDALRLTGNEAMFANRVVSRGSDPASLEMALTGEISEPTMRAHRNGPGSLKPEERTKWLELASASLDENAAANLPPSEKFKQFTKAVEWLQTASDEDKQKAADTELQKILSIPYEEGNVGGVPMRIYASDRGFASAYWSGQEYSAVKEGEITFVGSQKRPLQEIGVCVDKELSPNFGIIFNK